MITDIEGQVNQTRLFFTQALMPLHECIVNSIHATKFSGIENGLIEIHIERDTTESIISPEFGDNRPIKSFSISDNGKGFDDDNFSSFDTSHSTYKIANKIDYGAKGLGRFVWLKAFEYARIESCYQYNGIFKKRQFEFRFPKGIVEPQNDPVENQKRLTTVHLVNFKPEYQKHCPTNINDIASKILKHIMPYLVLENCPTIRINDSYNNTSALINDLYRINIQLFKQDTFKVKNFDFELDIYKIKELTSRNQIHFCADNREVLCKPLKDDIPELNKKIKSENDNFFISAYIKGNYLNTIVNNERTKFDFPLDEDSIDFPDMLSENDFKSSLINTIEKGLGTYLDDARENKIEKIKKYISQKAPQYRPLFKYKNAEIQKFPIYNSDHELELALFSLLHNFEIEVKKEGKSIFREIKVIQDLKEYKKKYNEYIEKVLDLSSTNLVKYIFHRKTVIEILEKQLKKDREGKFSKEETIHQLIFPLHKTSDDIPYDAHNLWLIDERLSFHTYLASDKKFDKIEITDIESVNRADIVVFNEFDTNDDYFNNHYVFSNAVNPPFQNVVIIEFKRPMRENYDYEGNPIEQIINYIEDIKADKKRLKDGRQFLIGDKEIPFYCYIICDLTKKVTQFATRSGFLVRSPDRLGYFGFHKDYNAYFEIISYDKLKEDAKQRNSIFFEKLNLPSN